METEKGKKSPPLSIQLEFDALVDAIDKSGKLHPNRTGEINDIVEGAMALASVPLSENLDDFAMAFIVSLGTLCRSFMQYYKDVKFDETTKKDGFELSGEIVDSMNAIIGKKTKIIRHDWQYFFEDENHIDNCLVLLDNARRKLKTVRKSLENGEPLDDDIFGKIGDKLLVAYFQEQMAKVKWELQKELKEWIGTRQSDSGTSEGQGDGKVGEGNS